jgi:hypothetical protein
VADPATGACKWSYDYTSHRSSRYPHGGGPGSAWYRLVQELKDARADGLGPLVVLSTATGDGQEQDGIPATPDPTAAGPGAPDATMTIAGEDYRCGVQALTYETHTQGLAVAEWEAWNEPDGSAAYNSGCDSLPNSCGGIYEAGTGLCGSAAYAECGPLEAAGLYATLSSTLRRWNAEYGWAVPPVGAGTLAWPSVSYFNTYLNQLINVIGQWPQYLSYHDYTDVTGGGYADSYALTKDVYSIYAAAGEPQPSIWISEAGVNLTDSDRSYDGTAGTCTDGTSADAGTLGACVNAQPSAQADGARRFLNLATSGAYAPGQITQLYWYQFQPANESTGWDSGLLAAPAAPPGSWARSSPDGVYGSSDRGTGLRASFCVLARIQSPGCGGGAVEGSHWSVQPPSVSGPLLTGSARAWPPDSGVASRPPPG